MYPVFDLRIIRDVTPQVISDNCLLRCNYDPPLDLSPSCFRWCSLSRVDGCVAYPLGEDVSSCNERNYYHATTCYLSQWYVFIHTMVFAIKIAIIVNALYRTHVHAHEYVSAKSSYRWKYIDSALLSNWTQFHTFEKNLQIQTRRIYGYIFDDIMNIY